MNQSNGVLPAVLPSVLPAVLPAVLCFNSALCRAVYGKRRKRNVQLEEEASERWRSVSCVTVDPVH